ncbi:hypothetical protein L6R29_16930 [Myxococcota bacterium]|nr:hypothetical protein [Myxococcota bacterium]
MIHPPPSSFVPDRDAGLLIPDYSGDQQIVDQLEHSGDAWCCKVFAQEQLCIVLGKGCDAKRDLHLDVVQREQIPLYRRQGGGGTVVLAPGMLIVAVAAYLSDPFGNKRYFHLIQTPLQEALASDGIGDVVQRGMSDLAIDGRKILGSSLRRQRHLLVYQAVLLVDAARDLFGRYLQHPPREPDYREGREHRDFTTNLRDRGLRCDLLALQTRLQSHLSLRLPVLLAADLLDPSVARGGVYTKSE